jgi:hypothetical protein
VWTVLERIAEDSIDIFGSPTHAFERRRRGQMMGMAILLCIALPIFHWIAQQGLANIGVSNADISLARALKLRPDLVTSDVAHTRHVLALLELISFGISIPFVLAMGSLVAWGAALSFGGRVSLRTAFMVVTLASFPLLASELVTALQALVLPPASFALSPYAASLSIARFLDATSVSPPYLMLLGQVDLIRLWQIVLMALGLRVAAGMSTKSAIAATCCGAIFTVAVVAGYSSLVTGGTGSGN